MKDFLRQISIFSELNEEELDLLTMAASEKHYPRNSFIIHKGEPGASLYLLHSGEAAVVLEKDSGEKVHLSTFRRGDFFGEMSLFDGKPRSASVVAQEDSTVVEISREAFVSHIVKYPEISLKIMAEIAGRVRQTDQIVKDFAEKIYEEAYVNLERLLTSQLDSAKTIYQKTEDRALNTEQRAVRAIDHVENSWKTLTRTLWIFGGAFAIFGSVLGFFGYQKYQDVNKISVKMEKALKDADLMLADITKTSKGVIKAAHETKLLRETTLVLRKIRRDFSLNKEIGEMDLTELRKGAENYRRSRTKLLEYIKEPDKYEPGSVVDAVEIFLQLVDQGKTKFKEEEEKHNIHESLLYVLRSSADWRVRLKARQNVKELAKLLRHDRHDNFREKILMEGWKKVIVDKNIKDDRLKEGAAIILANLGNRSEDVKRILVNAVENQYRSLWTKHNAAIALIVMGHEKGWKHMIEKTKKSNLDGLWAEVYLSRLGKEKLNELIENVDQKTFEELDDKEYFNPRKISKRIKKKVANMRYQKDERLHKFLGTYAEEIASCLADENEYCKELD